MIDRQLLLKDLQRLLPKIEQDILTYTDSKSELNTHLKEEYGKAKAANRTAEHFVAWREAQITQAAVAWLLTCVFVRFLEDNKLLDEPVIAGPTGPGLQHAKDQLTVYFGQHPTHAEREYLLNLFEELVQFPVMAELLDRRHNPLWQLPVSADGAKSIIDFFQKLDPETGEIVHDFTDSNWDTRFLGDLYQDLSESVRKRYALLQTPEFVESFILDYTLEKAKDTFGLPGLRLIDPTCGSGHFLLTTFERLFNDWIKREPTTNARALAQRALDSVYGVDINPYAIAIARFRLLMAAMKAAGSNKIKSAPDFHFNLAVGDSLLHGRRHESQGQGIQTKLMDDSLNHVFEVEDKDKLEKILGQRYHVVVGNPPYIIVRDKALNRAYRDKYPTCHRKYSLGVPFTERFFDLLLPAAENHPAGFMGMITTNSFMKREFGKKLIEEYLSKKALTHVIDTSVAHIPGHGTPTVILFARNREPGAERVRAVLGIRGEPVTPDNPALGRVWNSILELIGKPGSENDYVSVVDQERATYEKHPWSLVGGGANHLKSLLDQSKSFLDSKIKVIGFGAILGEDEAFAMPREKIEASRFPVSYRPIVEGEFIRDWSLDYYTVVVFPYDRDISVSVTEDIKRYLWPLRTVLWQRKTFGNQTYRDAGIGYAEYHQIPVERNITPLSITFAHVATHNHFVMDRGGKVFNRSAPVIKLPADATEINHMELLGLLNSSTACFWMQQVFHNKGGPGGGSSKDEKWNDFYDHSGTQLKNFPIPEFSPVNISVKIDQLATQYCDNDPLSLDESRLPKEIQDCCGRRLEILQRMIFLQEELDWAVYRAYGLIQEDLTIESVSSSSEILLIKPGQRAFEINLARLVSERGIETKWYARMNAAFTTSIPSDWPEYYQNLVERRIAVMAENKNVGFIERPEYKRRWNHEDCTTRMQRALRNWLLMQLERACKNAGLLTCAQLADLLGKNSSFQEMASLYMQTEMFDFTSLVCDLVAIDSVPQMAASRYKSKTIPKFRAWQDTWEKQRMEDIIDARTKLEKTDPQYLTPPQAETLKSKDIGDIPLPPRYAPSDFEKTSYWQLRGKLDVPKERFFSLPHCEKAGDNTMVIGWAGLNKLQRAQAIAAWYLDRKEQDGWDANKLTPMLVALDELIPWVKQWHNEIDPEYGERLGDYYEGFLLEELRQLDLSRDDLMTWEPPATMRGSGRRRKAS